jgi:Trehalose utilisation
MNLNIKSAFVSATLLLGLAAMSQAQTASLARQRVVTVGGKSYQLTSKLKTLLVGDFFYNYDHHQNNSPQNMISTLNRVAKTEGWTVDLTTDGNSVTATKLKGYQVFFGNYISSWASSNGFPTANRTAIQEFVENQGGGVFILHSTGDSKVSTKWDWYYNVAHPVGYEHESSRVTVSAPVAIPPAARTHPIMDGIKFNGKDTVIFTQGEWHTFAKIITSIYPKADVLLSMDGSHCTKGGTGSNCGVSLDVVNYNVPGGYPASWTFPDKKGTIGYFMEAHDLVTMQCMGTAVWDKFFTQFLYYIAGYDSIVVPTTIRPGKSETSFAVDQSGITFHPDDQAGVYISKSGSHVVSLFDMAGHKVQEIRGNKAPVDYNLESDFKGAKAGIYVMRVALAGGRVGSKRFYVH